MLTVCCVLDSLLCVRIICTEGIKGKMNILGLLKMATQNCSQLYNFHIPLHNLTGFFYLLQKTACTIALLTVIDCQLYMYIETYLSIYDKY